MKIFVSYSFKDSDNVEKIVTQLEDAGHFICNASHQYIGAPNLTTIINQGLDEADIVLAFITDNYNNSSYASVEFNAVSLRLPQKILAIVIGNAKIPSFMARIIYRKYDDFNSSITKDIINDLITLYSEKEIHSIASEQEIKLN